MKLVNIKDVRHELKQAKKHFEAALELIDSGIVLQVVSSVPKVSGRPRKVNAQPTPENPEPTNVKLPVKRRPRRPRRPRKSRKPSLPPATDQGQTNSGEF